MLIGRVAYNRKTLSVIYVSEEKKVYEIYAPIEKALSAMDTEIDISGTGIEIEKVQILPPVKPSKIICIGRNYEAHAKELGNEVPSEPMIFFKPPSCIIGTNSNVIYPKVSEQVDYEGEIALVIKKVIKNIDAKHVRRNPQNFFGYTAFLDMTARDIQKKEKLWTKAKGFDTFGPLGPWIELDPIRESLAIKTFVNNEERQSGNTKDMIFDFATIIEYISKIMTLEVGDVIATGTPEGVGSVSIGDKVKVEIDGLIPLEIKIVEEK